MPQASGAIPPERQRRFDLAVKALADLCAGHERRLSHYKRAPDAPPDPLDLERARWLLVAMGQWGLPAGRTAVARSLRSRGGAMRSPAYLGNGVWPMP